MRTYSRLVMRPSLGFGLVSTIAITACGGGGDSVTSFTGGTDSAGTDQTTLTQGDSSTEPGTTSDPTVASMSGSESTTDDPTTPVDTSGDTGPSGCTEDADCAGDPGGPVCNTDTGECVDCTAENDPCPEGNYCDPGTNDCTPGCIEDADCGGDLTCDVPNNTCVGCLADNECPLGNVCEDGTCVPGCNDQQGCPDGLACCTEQCVDIMTDEAHCGGCEAPCEPADATGECNAGICEIGMCDPGFDDCNGAANDGCEVDGLCACVPNQAYDCYSGPMGTEDVGVCTGGTQTCNAEGTALGPCIGQVLPGLELCASGQDENCDGTVDEDPDLDADGWTQCGGDCCDDVGVGCLSPDLVNPGAFEFGGNMVDDDCDGMTDNVLPLCDNGLASNSNQANDYARAIDLCQFTTLNPPDPADRIWGVISSSLTRANNAGVPSSDSRSIRSGFGNVIVPEQGQRLAILSSGNAADSGDANPNFGSFQTGQNKGTSSAFPPAWFAANGNTLPNTPGCPALAGGNTAFDPIMYSVQVRVPTNAQSFSVMIYFFSAEYPEYVCTAFNDFFVTLIESSNNTNPADTNIAVYNDNGTLYPVGVNILAASDTLFTQCVDGNVSQCNVPTPYNGCVSTAQLAGTGFELDASACGFNGDIGGGTGWLQMTGNVTPGEVMTLRFAIWDTSDAAWDSLVLLDDFQWSVEASEPGVQPS